MDASSRTIGIAICHGPRGMLLSLNGCSSRIGAMGLGVS